MIATKFMGKQFRRSSRVRYISVANNCCLLLIALFVAGCSEEETNGTNYPDYNVRYEVIATPLSGYGAKINNRGDIIGAELYQSTIASSMWSVISGLQIIDFSTEVDNSNCPIYSFPIELNDAGYVIGIREGCAEEKAYVWHESTGFQLLDSISPLQGSFIKAWSINNSNQIVGSSKLPGASSRNAFFWDMETNIMVEGFGELTITLLPDNPEYNVSPVKERSFSPVMGNAISDSGLVSAPCPQPSWLLCRWSEEGGLDYLQHPDSAISYQTDINNQGTIVGMLMAVEADRISRKPYRANFDSGWSVLPGVGGREADGYANAINNAEQIVGKVYINETDTTAVLWVDGKVYDLNDLTKDYSGERFIEALGINDVGQIIVVGKDSIGIYLLNPIQNLAD
jgi:hypothetical protein